MNEQDIIEAVEKAYDNSVTLEALYDKSLHAVKQDFIQNLKEKISDLFKKAILD
jgi:hypothetical protein